MKRTRYDKFVTEDQNWITKNLQEFRGVERVYPVSVVHLWKYDTVESRYLKLGNFAYHVKKQHIFKVF